MIYLINKKTSALFGSYQNLKIAKERIAERGRNESDFIFAEDIAMKYIPKIVYVDDKCIYNNKKYWTEDVYKSNILNNYDKHRVVDAFGRNVDLDTFKTELNHLASTLTYIDGDPGNILFNMDVGREFVALFREECVQAKFTTTTPLAIFNKMASLGVISGIETGCFREIARDLLPMVPNDEFLTKERIDRYIQMLNSADAIVYADERKEANNG